MTKHRKKSRKILVNTCGGVCSLLFGFLLMRFLHIHFAFSFVTSSAVALAVTVLFTSVLLLHRASRCVFFLVAPQFFSRKGRSIVVAYTFAITLMGPGENLKNNIKVLSGSIICGEDQLKIALQSLIQTLKEPYYTVKEAVDEILPLIRNVAEKMKQTGLELKRRVESVVAVIKKAMKWLKEAADVCNKNKGTPLHQCMKTLETSIINCRDRLGKLERLCDATNLAKMFCYGFKSFDYLCEVKQLVVDEALTDMIKRMDTFVENLEDIFKVSVKFDHRFQFETNSSKSIHLVHTEVCEEIQSRTEKVFNLFKISATLLSAFVLSMIITALDYKHKWMSSLHFDNVFITRMFHKINEKRARLKMDCVLPLTKREEKSFIELSKLNLVSHEYTVVFEKGIFLLMSTLHLCGILLADYSLYWLLSIVELVGHHGYAIESEEINFISIQINGNDAIAGMCRDIVDVLKPLVKIFDVDMRLCLPHPHRPSSGQYLTIGLLIIVSWLLLFLEPYSMRIRHFIMEKLYPDRTLERSVWLYHRILRKRTSFLKFVKLQMERKLLGKEPIRDGTVFELIRAKLDRFWIFRWFFGKESVVCMLCGSSEKRDSEFVKCETPKCYGIYCHNCFSAFKNSCPFCKHSVVSGDKSDVSEEIDSSEDDGM